MSAEFDISELDKLVADLAEAPAKAERVSSAKMTEIAAECRDDMKDHAPVLTGTLRDSIVVVGGKDYRIVKATARHAFFVEHGTSDTPPQPFARPAASRAFDRLNDALGEIDPLD